jgi:hypothetical protein
MIQLSNIRTHVGFANSTERRAQFSEIDSPAHNALNFDCSLEPPVHAPPVVVRKLSTDARLQLRDHSIAKLRELLLCSSRLARKLLHGAEEAGVQATTQTEHQNE